MAADRLQRWCCGSRVHRKRIPQRRLTQPHENDDCPEQNAISGNDRPKFSLLRGNRTKLTLRDCFAWNHATFNIYSEKLLYRNYERMGVCNWNDYRVYSLLLCYCYSVIPSCVFQSCELKVIDNRACIVIVGQHIFVLVSPKFNIKVTSFSKIVLRNDTRSVIKIKKKKRKKRETLESRNQKCCNIWNLRSFLGFRVYKNIQSRRN